MSAETNGLVQVRVCAQNDGIPGGVAVADDGAVQAGAPLSFTDNGDGTITDNNTHLMWEKKGDGGGLHDKDNTYSWSGNGETIWDWLDDVNAEGISASYSNGVLSVVIPIAERAKPRKIAVESVSELDQKAVAA